MPPRIVPKAYLDVQFLRKMIETYKPRLRTVNGRDPLVWWNEFIERIQREQDAMCPTCLGCLKKLASLKLLHKDPQKKEKRKQKSSAQQVWRKHLDECKLVATEELVLSFIFVTRCSHNQPSQLPLLSMSNFLRHPRQVGHMASCSL